MLPAAALAARAIAPGTISSRRERILAKLRSHGSAHTMSLGPPGAGAVKAKGTAGRTCNYPACTTVLSTYNVSPTCWLHTTAVTRPPLSAG